MKKFVGIGFMCFASMLFAAEPDYSTLIAHRGESCDAPENTFPAFQMAVDRGFGFECDLYLSTDKQVFSFHDSNMKRTTGVNIPTSKASWKNMISKVDAGKWKGKKWTGVRPALLEEILTLARDGRWIYLEIKSGPEIIPYVKEIFAKQNTATPKNVLFICFSKAVCKALRKQMPEYKVFWLTGSRFSTAEELIASLKEIDATGVDILFDPVTTDAELIRRVKAAGFEFHVWTVDHLVETLLAFERGVQTVTTNCAEKQLGEYREKRKAKRGKVEDLITHKSRKGIS